MAMLRSGLHSRRGLGDHGGNVLLFEWLISLRFTPEDARGYATALVRLGFDDLQSVREDATPDDLHRAGMKPGHIKRALKALDAQPPHQQQQQHTGPSSSSGYGRAQQDQHRVVTNKFNTTGTGAGHGVNHHKIANPSAGGPHSKTSNHHLSSATSRKSTSDNSSSSSSSINGIDNVAIQSAATGGWVVRSADGSSIMLPPGVSCVVCEDNEERPLRYAVAPPPHTHGQGVALAGHCAAVETRAVAGGRGIRRSISVGARAAEAVGGLGIRRSTSSGPSTVRRGGVNALSLAPHAAAGAAGPIEAPKNPGQIMGPQEHTSMKGGRGKHQRQTCVETHAPGHGASSALPNFGWRSAVGRVSGTVRSDGDKSRSPPQDSGDGCVVGGGSEKCGGGSVAGGCCGGRCGSAASSSRREYQSMPIVARNRSVSSARARLLCHGVDRERHGSGSSSGRGRDESGSGSPSISPSTEPGLIDEDCNLMGSSTESSGDMAPLLRVWDNDSASAGAAAHGDRDLCRKHHQPGAMMPVASRRLRVDVRARLGGGREAPGCQRHRDQQQLQQQQQQPPQHMSVLTSPPPSRGAPRNASAIRKPLRKAFCSETDSAAAAAGAAFSAARSGSHPDHDPRSPARRSRFHPGKDNPRSVAASGDGGDGGGAGRTAPARSGPPGRMGLVPFVGGNEDDTRLGDAGGALGRGGHLKTVRRIRSTVRMNNGTSNAYGPQLARISVDSDQGEAGRTPPPLLPGDDTTAAAAAAAAVAAAAAAEPGYEGGRRAAPEGDPREVVEVPEDILDQTWKRSGSSSGSRPLVTLDEDSVVTVASAEQRSGGSPGERAAFDSSQHDGDARAFGDNGCKSIGSSSSSGRGSEDVNDDEVSCGMLSGLSLDLGNLQEPGFGVEPSYDLSEDGGTLRMHGFVLKPDGIKSTPSTNYAGLEDSSRNSTSRAGHEDRIRHSRPAPLQTQAASTSIGRTPCSHDSTFGGSGGGRATGGPGVGGGSALVPLPLPLPPPPPPLTNTSRRTREKIILLDEIGRGSAGSVHKAIHVPSMRLVAVKMVEVHDDQKRHQILKELQTLIAMEPVSLPSPSLVIGDSTSSGVGVPGLGGSCGGDGASGADGSGTGSSCDTWEDEDSPKRPCDSAAAAVERSAVGYCGEGHHSGSPDGGQPTGTTATLSSRGGSLSSRDGVSSFPSQQLRQRQACAGNAPAAPAAPPAAPAVATEQACRQTRDHSGSDCGGGDGSGRRSRNKDSYLPVVTFHDAYMDRERGRVCMVMEYMNGGTLQNFVSDGQPLSEPALAGVARSVLRGLAEMHAQRKIHRDIKPSNILLDRQGRVKIADFGVVRELNKTDSFGQTFTGTTTYMSPERIQHNAHGCPSDIWSLGMVIATLALGHFPLSTSSTGAIFELMQAISEDPIPALSPVLFSPELCNFVELMLRRDPDERPTAPKLLSHPFLLLHQGCDDLVDMVQVAPATPVEVRGLLKKVVDYHLAAAIEDRSCSEKEASASFFGKDTLSWVGWSPRQVPIPPPLRKEDVKVLARQLQVTRTELVKEYETLRKQSELDLWGENPPPSSRSSWPRKGSASSSFGIAPATPGFHPHSRGGGAGGGRHGRRGPSSMSMSSPQCFDLTTCPTRRGDGGGGGGGGGGVGGGCDDTPMTAGSAFSAGAASRQTRRGAGTPARRSAAQRRFSPSCQEVSQPKREAAAGRCHAPANEHKSR